jgi:Skp family chaperone for outer membrane proteins
MTTRSLLAAGACAGALLSLATNVLAATPLPSATAASAAPAQAPIVNGPPLTGVCVFSEQGVLANSTVGHAVATRFNQLVQQVNAELSPDATSYQTDQRALEASRGTLDEPTYEKRAADLNLRRANLQRLGQQRQQELEYTKQHQVNRIGQEIAQVLPAVYQQARCSMLLDAQAVLIYNPQMDLTPAVVTALNARIQTLTFDRETPPAQPGAAGQQ